MSLALYRRYRPGTFAEVRGQEHVTEPLQQALRSGRTTHAYLFSGPRGCGKTSSARILARSLNCAAGPTPMPCGECDSCIALAPNGPGHLDVIEIDAASHGGVDDARDLRDRAFYAPVSSRYKIYIIDEAHMVSKEGFNALLKLVEEPPDFLKFVFATTEPDKVLPTIRSRTFHYPFRLVPPKVLQEHLAGICAQEGVGVDPLVFPLVVRAGAGSVRDALSVLDQLLAGAGPEGVSYAEAVRLLGVTDAALLDEVVEAFAAADAAAVFQTVDALVEAGHDPRRFTADLLERLRDLVVLDAVPEAGAKGLIDAPGDQLARMTAQAGRLGRVALSRTADIVNAGLTEMRGATSPRLLLELICARVLLPGAGGDAAGVLARLARVERRLAISDATPPNNPAEAQPPSPSPPPAAAVSQGATVPAAAPNEVAASAPAKPAPASAPAPPVEPSRPAPPEAPAAAGHIDAAAVRRVWPDVLDAVKSRRRTAHALLSNAQVVEVTDQTLTLSFDTAPLARLFRDDEVNVVPLHEALRQVFGVEWRVEATVSGAGGAAVPGHEEGFDPGDEIAPDDDVVDVDAPVRSGEDAAVALLEDGLGARPIDSASA